MRLAAAAALPVFWAATGALAQTAAPDPHAGHVMPGMVMPEGDAPAGHATPPTDEHAAHEGHVMPMGPAGHDMPPPDEAAHHAGHDMGAMGADHAQHGMPPTGILGAYPMTRDGTGTSWQPDASSHEGLHGASGPWSLMGHMTLNAVYDPQSGLRGGDKAFVGGMIMGAARREVGEGTLNLRAMLSPEPLMGPRGYPLLFAAGETADGVNPLIDRQHPHDLFMELSASYSRRLTARDSLFAYVGFPGEPAFGPPAFMHRQSIMASPEAPIVHHWLDSTHVTFGVATVGWVHGSWKLDASRFTGREPDQDRYGFEKPRFDSSAARLSWNPTPNLSLQGSWAFVISPEQLAPRLNERRWSASAIYTRSLGGERWLSVTAAWARKMRNDGVTTDASSLEASIRPLADWTVFARAERVDTDELHTHLKGSGLPIHTDRGVVEKASVGLVRDWRVAPHAKIGVGGLYTFNDVPPVWAHDYGANPRGGMLFLRLVVD